MAPVLLYVYMWVEVTRQTEKYDLKDVDDAKLFRSLITPQLYLLVKKWIFKWLFPFPLFYSGWLEKSKRPGLKLQCLQWAVENARFPVHWRIHNFAVKTAKNYSSIIGLKGHTETSLSLVLLAAGGWEFFEM